MTPGHDTGLHQWLVDVKRTDRAEWALGIAGGLLLVALIGLCFTASVVLV